MGWTQDIGKAISYIEDNITGELSIEGIAKQVLISPFYFQKGFSMLCGFTVGEYIRQRRLAIAGSELVATDIKIIDIAMKYGYDSPDSFTKAFTRFHGATPYSVRRDGAMIRSFAPLVIKFSLKGGYSMDYKIVEKGSFAVIGESRMFSYDDAAALIPQFWTEYFQAGKHKIVCGMYGICLDEKNGNDQQEYMIGDNYDPSMDIPEGYTTKVIPAHTWAVFACRGAMPKALQSVNERIYSEWLPNCKDYVIAADYNIEMYSDTKDYPGGNQNENYYCEIWIPVKKK